MCPDSWATVPKARADREAPTTSNSALSAAAATTGVVVDRLDLGRHG